MANDPYWNSVVLAMHMNDVGLTDLKGHAITLVGNAARSSAQSVFGGYSAYFDGYGDYLTTPATSDFNFAAGDFTVEFFVYLSATATSGLVAFGPSGYVPILIYLTSNEFRFYSAASGATSWNVASAVTFKTGVVSGQWYHIAVCRSGPTIRCFCDGVLGNSVSTSATLADSATALHVGDWVGANYLNGYIDDLRITKGVARYTANFTPSTDPFPDQMVQISGTVKDANSNLVARAVRAYRRSDGLLSGATTSSASDGTFVVDGYDDSPHYVVCLDDDLNENALILDNITPV